MKELYPLKFDPVFDERVWGGQRIRTVMGLDFGPLGRCAEAWLLSGYQGKQTPVSNGFLAGNEINDLLEVYMDDLVGTRVFESTGDVFPLLIKFIDAREWLSIQVHPDDELARKRGLANGKTEMWYVIDAEDGSELISGFKKKVSQKQFLEHLDHRNLTDILNYEPVKAGDAFFMPAGRIHSLGPGILLAEIQQTSDATYRIYDWDRTDATGKSRELHTDLALEAIDFNVYPGYRTTYHKQSPGSSKLVSCPYFTTSLLELAQPLRKNFEELDSFVIYLCLEGSMVVKSTGHEKVKLQKGEIMLVPASVTEIELYTEGLVRLLEIHA